MRIFVVESGEYADRFAYMVAASIEAAKVELLADTPNAESATSEFTKYSNGHEETVITIKYPKHLHRSPDEYTAIEQDLVGA